MYEFKLRYIHDHFKYPYLFVFNFSIYTTLQLVYVIGTFGYLFDDVSIRCEYSRFPPLPYHKRITIELFSILIVKVIGGKLALGK